MNNDSIDIPIANENGEGNRTATKCETWCGYSCITCVILHDLIVFILLIYYLASDDNTYQYSFKEMAIGSLIMHVISYFLRIWIFLWEGHKNIQTTSSIISLAIYFYSVVYLVIWFLQEENHNTGLYHIVGYLLLSEVITITLILLLCCCCLCCIFSIYGLSRAKHKRERRAAVSLIDAVTKTSIFSSYLKSLEKEYEEDNCCICQELFQDRDELRILICKHYYHKECIDQWLKKEKSCPICRIDIDKNVV